jgi:16S rRNA (uracil1498-N3)-methyltransferase
VFNFFADETKKQGNTYLITDNDYNHIKNVLRMQEGEKLLVSIGGKSDLCEIEKFDLNAVIVKIVEENYQSTELETKIYLFQGLPKSDKMELIIQKAVELGVYAIVPVEMTNCVVKLDDKKKKSKQTRWQAISESAAKQSKRNTIPEVFDAIPYKKAIDMAKELDLMLVPYENEDGMLTTKNALEDLKNAKSVGVFIGPEGGFDPKEIDLAKENGGKIISLGSRILRTETAAITAVSMCMLNIEMN